MFDHPVMDEAANVRQAFGISMIVFGFMVLLTVGFYVGYAYYYERKHRRYQRSKATQELPVPEVRVIPKDQPVAGKHRAEKKAPDKPAPSVVDTVVDMCIPREVLDYDEPMTRLTFLKADPTDTDYFNKIEAMSHGL